MGPLRRLNTVRASSRARLVHLLRQASERNGDSYGCKQKVPLRKCVATGEMLPKKEMIRVVRSKEGEVSVDVSGKKPGRGAYVSKSEQAVDLARKKNVLGHQLDVKIPEEIYEELILLIRRSLFYDESSNI